MSSQRIIERLIAWRLPLLALAAVAAAAAFFPARGLQFDQSVENMFASDDPLLGPYEKLKRTFGGNEVVLAVYRDDDLFHADGRGIRRLSKRSERLRRLPGVKDVIAIDQPLGPPRRAKRDPSADGRAPVNVPDNVPVNRIVDAKNPLAARTREMFEGYTHNADGHIAAIVCMLTPEAETDIPRRDVIDSLRKVIREYPCGMITGEPVMVVDGYRYVEQDGRRLGMASTILLAVTIILCFRSLRWVIVPIAVVQLTLLLTQAVLVWSKLRLSMVSSMLTAIVTVVGIATVVHVIVRFRDARADGLSPREALTRAGVLLAAPIFWACTTDAIGFASLCAARVGPVQDFGLMMAIGALLVVLSVALVVPGLALAGRFDADPKRVWGEGALDANLDRLVTIVARRPLMIGLLAVGGVVAAGAGASKLQVETDFTKNFRDGSPIVRSYEFVEENLGGVGIWDVILPADSEYDWQDWDYLRRVRHLEDRLRKEVRVTDANGNKVPGLTKVLSLADAVVAGSPTDPDRIPLREMRNALIRTFLNQLNARMPALVETLHGEDPENPGRYYVRVMLRAKERQPAQQKRQIIEQVRRIALEEFPPTDDSPGAEVTGLFVLLTNLIDSIVRDQWLTFGVATVGIGLMMIVALRSPLLAVIALIPNVMPILVVTGLMGWFGLKINMGAAMIAAVSMGLSIDSSIHYITAFRRARAEGQSTQEAIRAIHQTVGRAMVFSTLALIVGFTVLCTSQFVPTIYFGVLVSLAMLGGLAGNLVILPLLLQLVRSDPKGS